MIARRAMLQRLMVMSFLVTVFLCAGYAQQSQSPLPAPTGPYAVGRTLFNWVDESRVDLLNPKGYREIPVWVWYPASPTADAQKADWLPGAWGEIFAALIAPRPVPGQPTPEKYPINNLRSHSYADAPFADARRQYPIIIFAPGYGSGPTEYASLIEDLVSHGYIVAGIVPTYFSSYTVFLDGRVVGQHQAARDVPGSPSASWDHPVSDPVYRLWTGDTRFTLNQLEKLNADTKSPLKGRLDFDRVGVFGHSIGATATAQVAKDDTRVRAAILLDGTLMGDVVRNPIIPKPLLLMSASSFKGKERQPGLKGRNDVMNTLLHNARPSYVVTIAGTTHSFPADTGLMPFAKDWQGQSANPSRAMTITRAYVNAFFDQHLLGKASSLLNGPAPEYPEVVFENTFEQK
jgi:predicted dienelactone hydrolase